MFSSVKKIIYTIVLPTEINVSTKLLGGYTNSPIVSMHTQYQNAWYILTGLSQIISCLQVPSLIIFNIRFVISLRSGSIPWSCWTIAPSNSTSNINAPQRWKGKRFWCRYQWYHAILLDDLPVSIILYKLLVLSSYASRICYQLLAHMRSSWEKSHLTDLFRWYPNLFLNPKPSAQLSSSLQSPPSLGGNWQLLAWNWIKTKSMRAVLHLS